MQPKRKVNQHLSQQVSPFDDAIFAFQIRFRDGLNSRWSALEHQAVQAAAQSPFEKKYSALSRFFEEAEEAIASVVHEYFPKLLQVASAQRQHLGQKSPLSWTEARVLQEACGFLGIDEKFNHSSPPRSDSLVLTTTVHIALGIGWLDEPIPADFVLPGWVDSRWLLLRGVRIPGEHRGYGSESLPQLSRTETIEWIKSRESSVRLRLGQQIEREVWDGVIEAGKLLLHSEPAKNSTSSETGNGLAFTRSNGETTAKQPIDSRRIIQSYESFRGTLGEVRALVQKRKGAISGKELKKQFGKSHLGRAACDHDWSNWRDDFWKSEASPGNLALVFLEGITGLQRGTLKTRMSRARKQFGQK